MGDEEERRSWLLEQRHVLTLLWVPFLFYFIYLFLVALGLCCCAQAFSSCGEQLLVEARWLLVAEASLGAEHAL